MADGPGKYYEGKSFETLRRLFPGLPVHGERRVPTYYGSYRKVDVGVNNPGDYDYIIFECKDERRSTGQGDIDQILGTTDGVQALRGAVISNNKYTEGAIAYARAKSLDLYNLVDPSDTRLRPVLTIPTLHTFIWLSQFTYECVLFDQPLPITSAPDRVFLDNDGNVLDLVQRLWNDGALDRAPGRHDYRHDRFNMARAPDCGFINGAVEDIDIHYETVTKHFLYQAPLVKGEGLYDVLNGVFIVSSADFAIGPLSIEDIAKEEHEVMQLPDGVPVVGTYVHQMERAPD